MGTVKGIREPSVEVGDGSEHSICDVNEVSSDLEHDVQIQDMNVTRTCESVPETFINGSSSNKDDSASRMEENLNGKREDAEGAMSNVNEDQLEQQPPKDEKEEVDDS